MNENNWLIYFYMQIKNRICGEVEQEYGNLCAAFDPALPEYDRII